MTTKKIPAELHEVVLERAAGGQSAREISAWLAAEHKVTASYRTIARHIRAEGAQRADAAKTTARRKLATAVTTDINRLDDLLRVGIRLAAANEQKPLVWARITREVRGMLTDRLKLAGAEQSPPDEFRGVRSVIVIPADATGDDADVSPPPANPRGGVRGFIAEPPDDA